MKILFVTKTLGQELMGPMHLSRVLKDGGHETRALFLPSSHDVVAEVRDFAPDLLCYSPTTGLHRCTASFRRRNFCSIGWHISLRCPRGDRRCARCVQGRDGEIAIPVES